MCTWRRTGRMTLRAFSPTASYDDARVESTRVTNGRSAWSTASPQSKRQVGMTKATDKPTKLRPAQVLAKSDSPATGLTAVGTPK
jgi:DNA-binding transcriptional regulator of glucitol operon